MTPVASLLLVAMTSLALALAPTWSVAAEPVVRDVRHQTGRRGMVVAVCPIAAEAGRAALEQGGTAVDATVATAMALAVTWPEAGNIGGGGFMLVRPAADREPIVIDYREVAPLRATVDMLADVDQPSQYKLVGVPGTVAGLAAAHVRFGKLAWRELVMPAVRLAEEGFVVSPALAESLNERSPRPTTLPSSAAFTASQRAKRSGPRASVCNCRSWRPRYGGSPSKAPKVSTAARRPSVWKPR